MYDKDSNLRHSPHFLRPIASHPIPFHLLPTPKPQPRLFFHAYLTHDQTNPKSNPLSLRASKCVRTATNTSPTRSKAQHSKAQQSTAKQTTSNKHKKSQKKRTNPAYSDGDLCVCTNHLTIPHHTLARSLVAAVEVSSAPEHTSP